MSASNKQIAVGTLKEVEKELEAQLAGVRAALSALGVAPGGKKAGAVPAPRKRKGGPTGMTPGIQAALDARAVKSGKATPEQIERYNARVAAKAAAAPAAEGASLAEAAAN